MLLPDRGLYDVAMADVILFHHVQGLTPGVRRFAEGIGTAGHAVTVPDLFEGATFRTIEEGLAHAEKIGFQSIVDAGVAATDELPSGVVYSGFSLGALIAHKLVQTRPGASGALLYHHGDVPIDAFGDSWPGGVEVQIHVAEGDEFYEADVVEEFVRRVSEVAAAELFLYPGSSHLFADSSLDDYEPASTELVIERSLSFLDRLR